MTDQKLVTFGDAIVALEQGKRVARIGWNGAGLFVFKQVPAEIPMNIVPNMQSLPHSVKDEFNRRWNAEPLSDAKKLAEAEDPIYFNNIRYENQMCIVYPNNTLYTYTPSTSDALAYDWVILDEDLPGQDISEAGKVVEGSTFGAAISALKAGLKVTRRGWNGKDMYLYYVAPSSYKSLTPHAIAEFGETTPYRAYIAIKTAQNDVAVWSPSCSDAFAQDWLIHEENK